MSDESTFGSVRYVVQDVEAALAFYTGHLGFTMRSHPAPPFADVTRGSLRVLLSGPGSSGARATPADADGPGRNRIHLVVDDLADEVDRLRVAGVPMLSDVVSGPGGRQVLVADPDGNLVELFEPARSSAPGDRPGS
jgi:catechol 2,3-dioxygenase-like lactoylglutathione lyase family enzyme